MAEFTINHKITSDLGKAKGADKTNQTAIMQGVSKALEKALKNLSDTLSKKIANSLSTTLTAYLRRVGTGQSKIDIKAEARNISKQVSKDISNSIINALSKKYVGGRGATPTDPTRAMNTIMRNLDRHIESALGKINTTLQTKTKGQVQLDPAATKELSRTLSTSIGSVISKAIPKETGTTIRELSLVARTLTSAIREIRELSKSIQGMKKSGGGLDLTEIPRVVESFKKLSSEVRKIPSEFGKLRESTKKLVGEQKQIVNDLGIAISSAKKEIAATARAAKESPTKFLPTAQNVKEASSKIIKQVSSELGKTIKTLGVELEIPGIKKLESALKETTGELKKARQQPLPFQAKHVTAPITTAASKKSLNELDQLFSQIVKKWGKALEDMSDTIKGSGFAPTPRDTKILDDLSTELSKFRQAFKDADISGLKEIVSRTSVAGQPIIGKEMAKLLNEFKRALTEPIGKDIKIQVKEGVKEGFKEAAKELEGISRSKEVGQQIENIQRLSSAIRGPARPTRYAEGAIPATTGGVRLRFEGTPDPIGEKVRQDVKERVNELATSLKNLQDFMVKTLDEEFKASGRGWDIVRRSAQQNVQDFFKLVKKGNLKTAGKQFAFDIANVPSIKRELTGRGVTTKVVSPEAAVQELRESFVEESVKKYRGDFLGKIGEWVKARTKSEIASWDGLTKEIQNKLTKIKTTDVKGVLPSAELRKSLEEALGPGEAEAAFRATFAAATAERRLRQSRVTETGQRQAPFVRTVSVPAARTTGTGASVFETARGSQRALPRFATFQTGFEKIFEDLAAKGALIYDKRYAEQIKRVGVKPTGPVIEKADELARSMLKDLAGTGAEAVGEIKQYINRAVKIRAAGLPEKSARELETKIGQLKLDDLGKNMDVFIQAIEQAGISAYDVVKAMDKIEFQNIYDIMQKVLLQPLQSLAKSPHFDKSIRDYETALNQVVQTLPLVEPGRPRRAFHQENVLNLLTRTGGAYSYEDPIPPEKQTEYIKDLNLRLREVIKESSVIGEKVLKQGMRTISTLGVPEAQASNVRFLRPHVAKESERFLAALDSVATKMYTDILPELAPFGAQFTQLGRNIANVNNAMTSSRKDIDRLAKEFGATSVEGRFGTEFPATRTRRESELISGGRFGTTGYGFNVLTELRHTAGTMEDQILVSGKLANAMTSLVKTLVQPSAGGRLARGGAAGAEAIEPIRAGLVSDVAINKVFQEFQKVLGVPQKYPGQADRAFISEVKKALTVVRGEEVEVQQARLTEVFLNYFGRKFTTRFGSKGVSVTPEGLPESIGADIARAIQQTQGAKVKVLTSEERKAAGLGVALLPRSMGELLSDVLDKYSKQLKTEGFDSDNLRSLQDSLIQSGNKFILDLFKTEGLITPEEALKQTKLFETVTGVLNKLGLRISNDIAGIGSVRELFKRELPGAPTYRERPIDVRISSYGIGKRGLQPEFMEAMLSNIIGGGPGAVTTTATKLPTGGKFGYPELLGTAGQKGLLSTIGGELGFGTMGTLEEIKAVAKQLGAKDPKMSEVIAKRAEALEAASNYYTTVIDELGEARKSIVGEKFLSIVEEPGQFAPTQAEDIRRAVSGVKIDVPVFAAYASVFGETSKLMEEIKKGPAFASKKHWEFIKALQFTNDQAEDLQTRLTDYLEEIDLAAVKAFDEATGILAAQAGNLDPKSLAGTIFDIEKFPKPFVLNIPKATGGIGEKEPFYIPAPLARGTFTEELVAGERGFDVLARRIQHIINMAKQAQELLQRPAELQAEIDKLDVSMRELVATGKPGKAAGIEETLKSKKTDLDKMLRGEGIFSTTVRAKIVKRVSDLVAAAQKSTSIEELKGTLNTLTRGLSEKIAPAEAFEVKGITQKMVEQQKVRPLPPGASELENLRAFLEKELYVKEAPQIQAYKATARKAADLLIGQTPQAQVFFDKLKEGIREVSAGARPETSGLLRELQATLATESRFRDKPLLQSMEEKKRLITPVIEATRGKQTAVDRAIREQKGLEIATQLGINIEQDLQTQYFSKLDDLQKAKIDYYNELARAVVGKEGAIVSTLFSKTIPGLMQKAITATVDRTQELQKFKEDIGKILEATDPELINLEGLRGVTGELDRITEEHAEKVAKQRAAGFPVLRQHEIGIPAKAAKKLPTRFVRKFAIDFDEQILKTISGAKETQETLYDLLKYTEDLQRILSGKGVKGKRIDFSPEQRELVKGQLEQELFPYTEAIRYPFTGASSIVPYKAKLLGGRLGQAGGKALAVPGAPELDIEAFNKIIEKLREGIEKASGLREEEFRLADVSGAAPDLAKIAKLNTVIDRLAQAISETIPKYAAHTAKLDFDGDAIVVHTAKTREAREEIKRHHDTLVNFNAQIGKGTPFGKTTQGIYRDAFTSEALLKQKPTGPAILAESAEAFYKKFPAEKGFEFLKKPFSPEDTELFEERYKDAITAQLFKIQTGIETEALYRVNRLVESGIGFGGGFAGAGEFKPSERFRKRNPPGLGIVGAQPELDVQTFINELVRFAMQKGMDVKHAGDRPLAGELVKHLAQGTQGVTDLWVKVLGDESYSELLDFQKANKKAVELRLGALPTEKIRSELEQLYKARGTKYDPAKLAMDKRKDLKQSVVDAVGLKGFLEELAKQIQKAAVDGIIADLKKIPPHKRPKGAGDIETFAKRAVATEISEGGINIRKRIALTTSPLYGIRREPDLRRQLERFEKRHGELPVTGFEFRTKKPKEVEDLMRKFREARATAINLQEGLREAIQSTTGEATAQMMRGSIEVLHAEQEEIEKIVFELKEQGFDPSEINRNIANLKQRLLTETGIPTITAGLLKLKPGKRGPKMERLAELAGLPTLGREEKFEIGEKLLKEFAAASIEKDRGADVDPKQLEARAEEYANRMVEKAEVLFEMDRILDALMTRAQEGRFLVSFLPKKATPTRFGLPRTKEQAAQSFGFEKRMRELAGGPAAGGAGTPSIGLPPTAGGFGELYKGGIVPVHIASVARDLAVTFGPPTQAPEADEATRAIREARSKVEELRGLVKFKGADDVDYSKVFRASGLAGGGGFKGTQIENIVRTMLGIKEEFGKLQAIADVGTAIHLKIQKSLKEKLGKKVEIEKFVTFDKDDFTKPITGHIDAALKNTAGKVETILDIKTVGDNFLKALEKLAGASGIIDFETVRDASKVSDNVKRKLGDTASQLNLYIAALKQMGEASEGISAEAQFVSREAGELGKPITVKFGYDPARLSKDLDAVIKARELINQYIFAEEPLADIPEEYVKMVDKLRGAVKGKGIKGFAAAKSPEAQLRESLEPALDLTYEQINEFIKAATTVSKGPIIKPGFRLARRPEDYIQDIDPSLRGPKLRRTPDERIIPKAKEDFTEPLQAQLANLRELHDQTVAFQTQYNKLGLNTTLREMHQDIQDALSKRTPPVSGAEFNELISGLKDLEDISQTDVIKAWKLWRVVMGDFLSKEAQQAEDAFNVAKGAGVATREFAEFSDKVERFREFIVRSSGKRTDIYTQNRRMIFGDLARDAGAYLTPEQLVEKSRGIFPETAGGEKVRGIFESVVKGLESGGPLRAPVDVVREMVSDLSGVDQELLKLLEDAELVKRMGPELVQAWDFESITKGAIRLREALAQYSKFNLSEAIDIEARVNVSNITRMLTQIEKLYGRLDLGKTAAGPFGKYEAGLVKPPGFLPPLEQEAIHLRNIQRIRGRFERPEAEGGAEIGERFTYFMKVVDQAGNAVKNIGIQFRKYGESVDETGTRLGQFSVAQQDLNDRLRTTGSLFRSALKRVVAWGGAATLVYGGIQKLKDSLNELADIETGIAQLRMVMNPLETDFNMLTKSAVEFAKRYGVGVVEVVRGMKIFAQQGLKQAEVVDRTRVSTLAANVTTLSASEATEALTAAMKSFGSEVDSAMTALDAWSETEARHAITAADMANAIKKSAAAAKNAGFTFDELNGVVASIGAVTRQTGKEVGTAMRFIFRRLTSERGPKALAELAGIPTLTPSGELRRGFDVLTDLSMKWDDLTSAQKMNIAQAIGGTRQYNAVLVLMDNWQEALEAVEDSTNSKGSAERRNIEIMKTYTKQLEQMRASATELKMEFGKVAFPVFKFGLKSIKTFIELISAIPGPVKAAGIGLTLFFGYMSKGMGFLDGLFKMFDRGKAILTNFGREFSKQLDISKFEILGKGAGIDVLGLKTLGQGTSIKDFHSALGKLAFVLKSTGESYNKFLSTVAVGGSKKLESAGDALEKLGKKVGKFHLAAQAGAAVFTPGQFIDDIVIAAVGAGAHTAKYTGMVTSFLGKTFGVGAEKFAKTFAQENQGLVKSLVPLGVTIAGLSIIGKKLYGSYTRMGKSAQDYAKAAYAAGRANEVQLETLRTLSQAYDRFGARLKDINRTITDPGLKTKRQPYGTYVDPLLATAKLQGDAVETTNALAEANVGLIAGYDKLGNVILRSSTNLGNYIKSLEDIKIKQAAAIDLDVISKFIEDLTNTEGIEKWKYELKTLLKEIPVAGGLLAKGIAISPAKGLEVVTTRLNELINLRNKYPLTTVFNEDIGKYQKSLKGIRSGYKETYADFRKALSDLSTQGLGREEIAKILSDPSIKKGWQVIIEVEPEIKLLNIERARRQLDPMRVVDELVGDAPASMAKRYSEFLKKARQTAERGVPVEPIDVLGAEVLRRVVPGAAGFIGATGEITKARLETAGITKREGKALAGDVVTFVPEMAKLMDISGNQAVVELKKTTDDTFEWFIQYFNSKTLRVEERPFGEDVQNMVDSIFPMRQIQKDLAERMETLNEFVAGASAGLRGIGPKAFKRQFNLGERFFADIPTTTLLQSGKGFIPGGGGAFGVSPFQTQFQDTVKEFFFKPMREFRARTNQLRKLQLEGLEAAEVTIAKDLYEGLVKLQTILKNNQVVLQYNAAFIDLTKTLEQSTRTVKENIAIEKTRQELFTQTAGLMGGMVEGLDSLDVGVRNFRDLTTNQLALFDPNVREASQRLGQLNVRREGQRADVAAIQRTRVALDSIRAVAKGFGATLSPTELKDYTETVARTGNVAAAELKVSMSRLVTNTGETVKRLDDVLANMGDPQAVENMMSSMWDIAGTGLRDRSAKGTINAINRVAKIRDRAIKEGDQRQVAQADEAMNRLSRILISNVGFEKASKLVERRGRIPVRELRERALTGINIEDLLSRLEKASQKQIEAFEGRSFMQKLRDKGLAERPQPLGETREFQRLRKLQENANKASLIDSKALVKAATAIAVFEQFNKKHSSKVIDNLKTQESQLEKQISTAEVGADTSGTEKKLDAVRKAIVKERAVLDLHKMAQSISIIAGGTLQFGRALGFSEKNIKRLGAGAIALYGAIQLVTKFTGKDMPDSAKEFGKVLKEAAQETLKEGGVSRKLTGRVRKAGKKFEEAYGERFKEFTGVSREEFTKQVEGEIKEKVGKAKGLPEAEIEKMAKDIRLLAKNNEDINRLQQLLVVALVTGVQGYLNEKLEPGVVLSTLEQQAKEQTDAIADLLNKYGDTTEAIIKDEIKRADEMAKLKPVEAETEVKSLVSDTDKHFKEMHENINTVMDSLSQEIRETAREIADAQNTIARGRDVLTRAMSEVTAQQSLERIPAFREYQEDRDRLLGGPLPGAIVPVTPMQTREGKMFGMDLQNLKTTRAQLERFELLKQLRGAEGEQAYKLQLQLRDLPDTHRREVEVYEQRKEDARLLAQTQPYEALALDIQRLRQVRTIPEKAQEALEAYQKAIGDMLSRATDLVSKEKLKEEVAAALKAGKITEREAESELKRIKEGGPTQYRGTLITGVAGIEKLRVAAQERFLQEAPTRQMIEMKEANKPVVDELKHQTDVLEVIAKEGLDISAKKLPEHGVTAPTSLKGFSKDTGFLEKIWSPSRILKMLDPRTHFNPGGKVFGEGGPREDKVPAMLSPGEYVVKAASAQRLGYGDLEYMNKEGKLPSFRGGGLIGKRRAFQAGGKVADFDMATAAEILKQLGVDAYVAYTSTGKIPAGFKPTTPAVVTPTVTPKTAKQKNVLQKFKDREKIELEILRKAFPDIETDPALKAMRDFYIKKKAKENKKRGGGRQVGSPNERAIKQTLAATGSTALDLLGWLTRPFGAVEAFGLAPLGHKYKSETVLGKTAEAFGVAGKAALGELFPQYGAERPEFAKEALKSLGLPATPTTEILASILSSPGLMVTSITKAPAVIRSVGSQLVKKAARKAPGTSIGGTGKGVLPKAREVSKVTDPELAKLSSVEEVNAYMTKTLGIPVEFSGRVDTSGRIAQGFKESLKGQKALSKQIKGIKAGKTRGGNVAEYDPSTQTITVNKGVFKKKPASFAKAEMRAGQESLYGKLRSKVTKEPSRELQPGVALDPFRALPEHEVGHVVQQTVESSALNAKATIRALEAGQVGKTMSAAKKGVVIKELKKIIQTAKQAKPFFQGRELAKKTGKQLPSKYAYQELKSGQTVSESGAEWYAASRQLKDISPEVAKKLNISEDVLKSAREFGEITDPSRLKHFRKPQAVIKAQQREQLEKAGGFQEGGIVSGWLKTAIDFWFGSKAGVKTEKDVIEYMSTAKGYGNKKDRERMLEIGSDISGKKFQAGGKVKRFVASGKGTIYQVNEDGEIAREIAGTGTGTTPRFAEETATKTGRQFGRQATQLHRMRQRVTGGAEEAAFQRQRKRGIAKDVNVRRMLRKPGIDQEPGDEAIRSAYGLNTLEFDRQRGTVSFEGVPGGRVSYHDLREIGFQDLSRAMKAGEIPAPSILGRLYAGAKGMASTPGADPQVRAELERRQVQKDALRSKLLDVKPGDKLFREAGIHFGRETALLLPIYHALKSMLDMGPVSAGILRNYGLAEDLLLGRGQLTASERERAIGDLVRYHKLNIYSGPIGGGQLKKRDGGSLSVFHHGGIVPQTGPIFAQKGEVLIPKGLAEGGIVDNKVATATLKGGTIRLEDSGIADKIAAKIKEALESVEVKIDEDAKVGVEIGDAVVPVEVGEESISVDTTGISVPVDVGDVSVPVEVNEVAGSIGAAVRTALEEASIDVNVTGTGAVGADDTNVLASAITEVQDKLITVKDDLETRMVETENRITTTMGSEVESRVTAAMNRIQQDVNEQRTTLSLTQSKISRVEHNTDFRIAEAERLAKDAQNFATRPPMPTLI